MAKQHLLLLSPDIVFAARVNEPSGVSYPLSSVEFDGVTTGAYTDIKVGMTVLFGTVAGADDVGRKRIRAQADTDTIFVGRGSQGIRDGEFDISDNDYITVLSDRRVWSKIPYIDSNGTVYKDEAAWTDQTDEIPPKANITGGAVAATINSGTSKITVDFSGTASYAVASGATISSYLWDVDDGTITVGTAASSAITATFPAGFRWVKLTVTDSNGKTHFMEVPVYADNPASSDCVAFQCTEHNITQIGQRCSFEIMEDIPISSYPDGTLVIFWEGEPASASDRSNVKFWGWHQTDQNSVTAQDTGTLKGVTLNCLDIAGRLDTLPGFPQSVARAVTPANWLEMTGLNMDLYLDYLFRWHSTAFELAYYTPSGTGSGYRMVIIGSDGQSLFDQCARRADAIAYRLTCNRNGALRVIVDPFLQDTGDRTATSQATITAADYTAVSWEHHRPPRIHWDWGESIVESDSVIEAVFSVAPGETPGQGESESRSGEQLVASQAELNKRTGHYYAYLNAFNGQIAVTMPTDDGIEPADMTWVTLTIPDALTRRALGITSKRGLPVELNITYEYAETGMSKTVEMLWEQETSGTPAVTYVPPEPVDDPPYIPPPIDPPPPVTQGDGFGTAYTMYAANLIRTRALSAASPSWTAIKTASGENFYDWILDPFAPTTNGLLLGSAGVYRSTNLDQSSPTFTLVLSLAQMNTLASPVGTLKQYYKIQATIKHQDFFAFGAWDDNGDTSSRVIVFVTEDGGDNWSAKVAYSTTGVAERKARYWGAMDISQSESGPIIGLICGRDGNHRFLLSEDGGDNWAQKSSGWSFGTNGNGEFSGLHFPYNSNSDTTKVLASLFSTGLTNYIYHISDDQGVTWSPVTAADISGDLDHDMFNRDPFQSWTQNYQELYAFGAESGTSAGFIGFYRSSNFGSTWSYIGKVKSSSAGGQFPNDVKAAGGFPYNSDQFYVLCDSRIFVTTNGGSSWTEKTGDWAGATDTVLHCGGVIVPVWVKE